MAAFERASIVNSLSLQELEEIIFFLKNNSIKRHGLAYPYVELTSQGWRCNLRPTRQSNGKPKYPQIDLNRFSSSWNKKLGKQLVHLIWWRAINQGLAIRPDMAISHRHEDPSILCLVQESKEMNESRKYCHKFRWYKRLAEENQPRCPHWENPCLGNDE